MIAPATRSRTYIPRLMIASPAGRGRRSMIPGDAVSMPSIIPIGATISMCIQSTCAGLKRAVPAIPKTDDPVNASTNMKRSAIWIRRHFCRLS